MPSLKSRRPLTGTVLLISLGLTYLLWQQTQQQARHELLSEFDFHAQKTVAQLEQRLSIHKNVLLGLRALFNSSDNVTREEFNSYVSSLALEKNYPGIQGISHARIIRADEKAAHIAGMRQQGFPDYTLHPPGEREIYMVVIYIEPLTRRNARVLGYDTYVEAVRQSALDQARDSGKATISHKVTLVQETDENEQAGFLMFVPLYRQGVLLDTAEERRANLIGYVNAAFRMDNLMVQLGDERASEIDLEIYDGEEISDQTRMYDSDGIPVNMDEDDSRLKTIQRITIADHVWTLAIQSSPEFEARIDTSRPVFMAVAGIIFSILITLLINAYMRSTQIRRELQESEERWRYALEGAGDGVWDWDLRTNKVNFSSRWKSMLGYADDEIRNDYAEWEKRVHPDDLQAALKDVTAHVEGRTPSYINEHRLQHKNGSWVWILARGMIISRDRDGRPTRFIGTHTDITDRKQMEHELNDQREFNTTILEAAGNIIVTLDASGHFVQFNHAAEKLTGFRREELLGQPVWDWVIPQEQMAGVKQVFDNLMQGNIEIAAHHENDWLTRDGSRRTLDWHNTILRDKDGKPTHVVTLGYDITERNLAENELKEQRDFNKAVFEAAGNVIAILDTSARIVQINHAVEVLTGFHRIELTGQSIWDRLIPEDQMSDVKKVFNYLCEGNTEKGAHYTNDWLTHDGSRRTLDWHNTVLRDTKGNITHILAQGYDITERKQAETALRESERRLATLISNLPGMAYRCLNAKPWTMLFISDACETITGYAAGDILNDNKVSYADLIHPDDADMVWQTVQNAVRQGDSFQVEYRILNKNSNWHWVQEQGRKVSAAEDQPEILEGYIADITEHHQMSLAIKNSQQELQKLLDDMQTMTGIMKPDGTITFVNNTPLILAEIEDTDVLGKKAWDCIWFSYDATTQKTVKTDIDKAAAGESILHDMQIYTPGGLLWIEFSVHPVFDADGKVKQLVAEGRDISQRKLAEDQLRELNASLEAHVDERTSELKLAKDQADAASLAKSNFLSNMSHEIRSPLAAIIGFSESLLTDSFSEGERKKITSTIVRNGKHLQQVINDILDLSKIEAEQLEIELINTSIFVLMGEVDSLLGMSARDKGLEFKIEYHFPLPEHIITDPTCLKQVLVNLCSNAIKFTNEGHIKVEVSCDRNYRQISFIVSDSGIGMTPEEMSRVFDPFAQADVSTTRKYGGTGLGLSISSKLAVALNGNLTCESEKGRGSRFLLTITNHNTDNVIAIKSMEEVSVYFDVKREQAEIRPLKGSILLVEDSPDNQQLVSMYIRKTGARLTIVENGMQAIEKTKSEEFDLIFMDMQMPVMDGLEAITRLRAAGYSRPIVSLTANAMLSDREKCEAAGADDYLVKPIELHHFYQILNQYLPEDETGEYQALKQTMLDSPKYRAMVERFLAKLPRMLDDLTRAVAIKNWHEVQTGSHDLKGMGGAMGYPEITEIAGQMNTLVKQQHYDQLVAIAAQLETLCHRIIQQHPTRED